MSESRREEKEDHQHKPRLDDIYLEQVFEEILVSKQISDGTKGLIERTLIGYWQDLKAGLDTVVKG